jgi:hypothetical protein
MSAVMGWPSASRIAQLHRRDSSPTTKCTDRANLVASRLASVTPGANSLMAASSRGEAMIFVSILFDYSVMYSSRAPPFLSCNFGLKKQPFRVLRKAHRVNHLVPGISGVEVMPPIATSLGNRWQAPRSRNATSGQPCDPQSCPAASGVRRHVHTVARACWGDCAGPLDSGFPPLGHLLRKHD